MNSTNCRLAILKSGLLALFLASAACSSATDGPNGPGGKHGPKDDKGNVVNKEAADKYSMGLSEMEKHDKAGDWNAANCEAVAKIFLESAD